jgi:hypothetical protein
MEIHPPGLFLMRFLQRLIVSLIRRHPRFREFVGHYRQFFKSSFKSIFFLMLILIVTALIFREYAIYPALAILCTWFFAVLIVQTLEFVEFQEGKRG